MPKPALLLGIGCFIPIDMFLQAGSDIGFLTIFQLLLHFIEGKMDDVVVVKFVR